MADTARRATVVEATVVAVGLALATAVATIGPLSDPDAWWNLRAGRGLLANGVFSGPDSWTRFSTHDFVLTEWLGSVVAALLYAPFGPASLVWMRSAGGLMVVVLLFVTARRNASLPYAAMGTLLGLLGFSGSIAERPQTLGLVLFLCVVLVWRRAAEQGDRPTLWLLPLSYVFACSHGYWTLGVVVGAVTTLGLALDGRPWRNVVLPAAATTLATALLAGTTPVGPRLLVTPFTIHTAAAQLVGEWGRASLNQPLVCIGLGMALGTAVAWLRTGTTWWRALHLLLAAALVLSYSRMTAPACALLAPMLAEAGFWFTSGRRRGAGLLPTDPEPVLATPSVLERRLLTGAAVVVLVFATALAPATSREMRHTPTALASTLQRIPVGSTVLNDYNVASWLLFTEPQLSLVIDTRLEVYDSGWVREYASALAAEPGWTSFVGRTGAKWAVLRSALPLTSALEESGWLVVSKADGYVVLQERTT